MTTSDLATLINGISGQHVVAYFLVLSRITPLFIVAPVFSSPQMIPRVRTVLALALAFGLTPLAEHGVKVPTDALTLAGMLLEGFIIGFALAYAIACMFAAVQSAGILSDSLSGFSYGSTVDPVNGNPGGSLANLYAIIGMALFLAIGGDGWTLRGLAATFRAIPINGGPKVASLVSGAGDAFTQVMLGAVEIAAPVLLALVVTDVAFGMVSKVVPQLNIFAVGFPVKVGVALIIVGISIPFLGGWMNNQLTDSVGSAVNSLVRA
jgi:flagellar biosynthesis protein FliR